MIKPITDSKSVMFGTNKCELIEVQSDLQRGDDVVTDESAARHLASDLNAHADLMCDARSSNWEEARHGM